MEFCILPLDYKEKVQTNVINTSTVNYEAKLRINNVEISKDDETTDETEDLFGDDFDENFAPTEGTNVILEEEITQSDNTNLITLNISNNTKHSTPSIANLTNKLLRIEYPGRVHDVQHVVETLGGLKAIELTVGNANKRFELKFRPEDFYSKCCFGDKNYNNGLLARITKVAHAQTGQFTYTYSLIGVTNINVEFNRMCDFQYLPLMPIGKEHSQSDCVNMIDLLMPDKLPDTAWLNSKLSNEMPLFLPPQSFSTHDTFGDPEVYFTKSKVPKDTGDTLLKRKQKTVPAKKLAVFVNFEKTKKVPQAPSAALQEIVKMRKLEKKVEEIARLFRERPIWYKTAIAHKTGLLNDTLKIVLPAVAYYFYTGPWRILWVRYGYDPRQTCDARIYQTFDYRIRASEGLKLKVQAKRQSAGPLKAKGAPFNPHKFTLSDCEPRTREKTSERDYVLRPDVLPSARQLFYQYCDILIPEVQEMIARLPQVPPGTVCHPKKGWLPDGFIEQCREIVNRYVKSMVKSELSRETQMKRMADEVEVRAQTEKAHEDDEKREVITIEEEIAPEESAPSTSAMEVDAHASSDSDGQIDSDAAEEINALIGNM